MIGKSLSIRRFGAPHRRAVAVATFVAFSISAAPAFSQDDKTAASYDLADVEGTWTYRSFHNDPAPIGENPNRALRLLFAEATFTFNVDDSGQLWAECECVRLLLQRNSPMPKRHGSFPSNINRQPEGGSC